MRALARIGFAVAISATLLTCRASDADLMLLTIRAPQQCPPGLTLTSKAGADGMLDYEVNVDAEGVAHAGELYRGQVRARAILSIKTAGQPVASVTLHGSPENNRTRYQFRLSPSAARSSELQLGVSLYEKDGRPTFGGGVSMQIYLAGFEPVQRPTKPK